jgi:hypothetical protein
MLLRLVQSRAERARKGRKCTRHHHFFLTCASLALGLSHDYFFLFFLHDLPLLALPAFFQCLLLFLRLFLPSVFFLPA